MEMRHIQLSSRNGPDWGVEGNGREGQHTDTHTDKKLGLREEISEGETSAAWKLSVFII